jgi:hypothetical protein
MKADSVREFVRLLLGLAAAPVGVANINALGTRNPSDPEELKTARRPMINRFARGALIAGFLIGAVSLLRVSAYSPPEVIPRSKSNEEQVGGADCQRPRGSSGCQVLTGVTRGSESLAVGCYES